MVNNKFMSLPSAKNVCGGDGEVVDVDVNIICVICLLVVKRRYNCSRQFGLYALK